MFRFGEFGFVLRVVCPGFMRIWEFKSGDWPFGVEFMFNVGYWRHLEFS